MILMYDDDAGVSGWAIRQAPGAGTMTLGRVGEAADVDAGRAADVRRLARPASPANEAKAAKIALLRSLVDPTPIPLRRAG